MNDRPSFAGKLLVAAPTLVDPNFRRSVVLVIEHGAEGAAGVILDRASEMPVADALPRFAALAAPPSVVFIGGPVAEGAAVMLARASDASMPGWRPILGSIGVVDLSIPPDELAPGLQDVRLFNGYAGWGAGQLEAEVADRGWYVVEAEEDDLLTPIPHGLWRVVLRRQGGELSMVATFPDDPSMN